MTVYLIHFDRPYKHARHYLGWARDLNARLAEHRRGTGARLIQVIQQAGIRWRLARTWEGGRDLEQALKTWKSGPRLCPLCWQARFVQRMFPEKQADEDIVNLGQGAMLIGLPQTYDFTALDMLLTMLEQAGANQEIVLETTPNAQEVTHDSC